jgi:hypothetical protein
MKYSFMKYPIIKNKFLKNLSCILSAVIAAAVFSGCGNNIRNTDSPIIPEESDTVSASTAAEDVLSEEDSVPPHEGMVRSRLTNQWVEGDVAATRPIAVMIPNEKNAIPHYNISKASILYEANVEGRMTRLMGIFEDWENLDKTGNVRSLRSYYAYWAFEWDAIIVHAGGPFFINELIDQPDTDNIDMNTSIGSTAFYRANDRKIPHNAYITGEKLSAAVEAAGYSTQYRGLTDEEHFKFASSSSPNTLTQYGDDAVNAELIDMSGSYPLTRCYFEYNDSDGLYYRFQHLSGDVDGPHIDAATGEQLSFKNIIVQSTRYEDLGLDEGYLTFQCHDNTMDGWFFTEGKGIHVTWEKDSDYSATKYYDDNGNEITLNTGKTMICVIEEGDTFSYR